MKNLRITLLVFTITTLSFNHAMAASNCVWGSKKMSQTGRNGGIYLALPLVHGKVNRVQYSYVSTSRHTLCVSYKMPGSGYATLLFFSKAFADDTCSLQTCAQRYVDSDGNEWYAYGNSEWRRGVATESRCTRFASYFNVVNC